MKLPDAFYAEPRVRADNPNIKKLRGATHLVLGTPEAVLALSLDYYRTEAYATEEERDRACGPAANKDVCYFPVRRIDLHRATQLDLLGCGHGIGHPQFERIFFPIFMAVLSRLIGKVTRFSSKQNGTIATAALSIARARYTVSVTAAGDWRYFSVEGLALFEDIHQRTLDRTIEYLNGRLMLELSPILVGAVPN